MQKGSHHSEEAKARISEGNAHRGGRRQIVFHEGHITVANGGPRNCPGCRNGPNGYGTKYRTKNAKRENKRNRDRRLSNRLKAIEYLGGECVDCSYSENPEGLQFDHLPAFGKPDRQALLMTHTWPLIQAELDKCELVCGTCHSIRTAQRRGT
jgi:hypothetical protein